MFGGIVMVAILMIVMSQACGIKSESEKLPAVDTVTPEVALQQDEAIQKLMAEIAEWEKKVGEFPTPETLKRLQLEIDKLKLSVRDLTTKITAEEGAKRITELEWEKKKLEIDDITQKIALLKEKGDTGAIAERLENKRPVFLSMMNGRLYAVHDLSQKAGDARRFDEVDVQVDLQPPKAVIKPRAGRGQVIADGFESRERMALILQNVDPASEILSFAVYADSFAEFQKVRECIIQNGYGYNWSPVPENESFAIQPGIVEGVKAPARRQGT